MIERAAALGVDLLWQTAVTGISGREVQLGQALDPSPMDCGSRWSELACAPLGEARCSLSNELFDMLFAATIASRPGPTAWKYIGAKHSQGYATAVSREQVCVAVASRDPELRLEESLPAFPETQRPASRSGDCFCRAGLSVCESQAEARLARKCRLDRRCFRHRRCHHRRRSRPFLRPGGCAGKLFRLGQSRRLPGRTPPPGSASSVDGAIDAHARRPPWFQQRTLQAFRKHPEVFRRLLALHVGSLSPFHLALDGLTLGWGLLTA